MWEASCRHKVSHAFEDAFIHLCTLSSTNLSSSDSECAFKLIGNLLISTLGKASIDGNTRIDRIGECNSMWSERSTEVSNWFIFASVFQPRARELDLENDVTGISSFLRWERRRWTGKPDLTELENAIPRDLKVQVKFQTDFFLALYVIHVHDNLTCKTMSLESPHFYVGKGVHRRKNQNWPNRIMQFHVIGKFKWSFKLIFFASMSSTCTTTWPAKRCLWNLLISTLAKGVDRRENQTWPNWRMQFHVIGKFKWSFKLTFFCLCMSSTLHEYMNVHDNVICNRMCLASPHLDVWRPVDLLIVLQGDH